MSILYHVPANTYQFGHVCRISSMTESTLPQSLVGSRISVEEESIVFSKQ